MTDRVRRRLLDELAVNTDHLAALEHEHALVVAATETANGDDEHDPEGATIAFEREQVTALLNQARRTRAELEHALTRLEAGTYRTCEQCGGPIGADRLRARPRSRTCIACAQ